MTFATLQTEILDRLGLTSTAATTRIGRAINIRYRSITSAPWLDQYRRTVGSFAMVSASSDITTTSLEKIEQIVDRNPATDVVLNEVSFEEIAGLTLASAASPTRWAVKSATATGITIILDILASTTNNLEVRGLATVSDLSGSSVPVIPESFHNALVYGVLADEYRKMEKGDIADKYEGMFDKRVDELRLFATKTGDYRLRGKLE